MNLKSLFSLLSLSFLLIGVNAQKTDSEGFVSLFDGESLIGWTASTENAESFKVKKGSLVCKGGKAHLFYTGRDGKADFTNFELKLRAKTTAGSNSGVYFHTQYQKEGWPEIGFEAQVNSTHTDPRKTGSLYGIVNMWSPEEAADFVVRVNEKQEVFVARESAPSTDDEWFDYHIIVVNNSITIKVNGQTMVEWTQPEEWTKKRRIGHGTVALQAHDPKSEVHYQDIRIKVLD